MHRRRRDSLELALIENLQREDLNAIETAIAYRELIDRFGMTHEAVARQVGKSRVAVSNSLRLLDLAPETARRSPTAASARGTAARWPRSRFRSSSARSSASCSSASSRFARPRSSFAASAPRSRSRADAALEP